MYADTQVIRSLARTMQEQADDLRHDADRLLRRAEAVPWQGLAADAMRAQARERTSALRHTAALHDAAADALDRHAAEVDRVKRLIDEIDDAVTAMVPGLS